MPVRSMRRTGIDRGIVQARAWIERDGSFSSIEIVSDEYPRAGFGRAVLEALQVCNVGSQIERYPITIPFEFRME